jgi:hypothetical protein
MSDEYVSPWARRFVGEPKNVTPREHTRRRDFRWLREMTEAWHDDLRERSARARRKANRYGAAFLGLFVLTQAPGPGWIHWGAFLTGMWCGSQAYKYWSVSQTLGTTARMEPPELTLQGRRAPQERSAEVTE